MLMPALALISVFQSVSSQEWYRTLANKRIDGLKTGVCFDNQVPPGRWNVERESVWRI